jgi:hypothetical protein
MKFKNIQVPVLITTCVKGQTHNILIDKGLLEVNVDLALQKLWTEYFEYITGQDIKTVFVHNLGSFDGFFIYKGLIMYSKDCINNVKTIVDDQNEFISITYKGYKNTITWKDSYRIFPVSLNQLCKIFQCEGKLSKYDDSYNDLSLFHDYNKLHEFIKYGMQDAIALYNALLRAQDIYISNHNVDICSALSTSTLSLKIFRQHFLGPELPILKPVEDGFIRKAYFGGATDYYKAYAKDVYYYDVNSLYPHAMLNKMPNKISYFIKDMRDINLDDFFGFCLAKITTPDNILRPVLPYKLDNRTIFPVGTWTGTYFSEELKAVSKLGYKIELISGYAFTKEYIFNDYVKYFYELKKNSNGPERFIAKMHLNQLYGYFGRKLDLLETININKEDLPFYLMTRIVKGIIKITPDICAVLVKNNINTNTLAKLNLELSTEIKSLQYTVKSNVAIAAAVTAYARIHMIPFKLNPGVCYTDTDSIFTTNKLPESMLGQELGLMKD